MSTPYKICITQLALFTGYPRLAPTLVRQLAMTNASAFKGDLSWSWRRQLPADVGKPLEKVLLLVPVGDRMRMDKFA